MFRLTRSTVLATLLAAAAIVTACNDSPDDPIVGGGEPENISRVTVNLTAAGTSTLVTANRFDPDGTQLPLPVGTASATLVLHKGITYSGNIGLMNDLDPSNVINISTEVTSEANFHRFFYTLTCAGVSVPVTGLNRDTQSPTQPFGLTFQLVVDAAAATNGSCTLNVQLHHFETNKGDGSGNNFETDLDIDFLVSIQP